jgi:polyisoprenoid-binding protein YceI
LQDIARCGSGVTVPLAGNEFAMSIPGFWRALLVCLGLIVLTAFVPAVAKAQGYRIAADRTTAGFTVSHLGILRQEGQFHRVSGTILLDPARARGGSIEVAIDLSSVDTGWKLRDDFIRGEDMFDVARYPVMQFRSTHLDYRGQQIVAADGNVTLHGMTKPMRLVVQRLECRTNSDDGRESCGAIVSGRLLRREFGMEYAYPFVGDVVTLDFAITAFRIHDEGAAETR